ncbi:IPP transferase domain containing protein [Lactarius tabidus]
MTLPKALRPIIAICGSTGVGKSKLAVELALDLAMRLNRHGWKGGVVVNADSMQTYKGFNTLTNKIPLEERAGVDHVLMDFKEPTEQYSIGQWVRDATQAIDDAHQLKKIPILVGGTTYWIQHLAFPGRETSGSVSDMFKEESSVTRSPRWVLQASIVASSYTEGFRYDTLCFWLYADPAELMRRLNERADDMLRNGLLDDIRKLRSLMWPPKDSSPSSTINLTLGIYQSIGFREFHKYLSDPSPSEKKYQEAAEEMKFANRQYAQRQNSWIRNKFLPAVWASKAADGGKSTEAYLLDTSEPERWTSAVRNLAVNLTQAFLNREALPNPLSLSPAAKTMLSVPTRATDPTTLVLLTHRKVICPVCTTDESKPVMVDEGREWEAHARSKVHRHRAAKRV